MDSRQQRAVLLIALVVVFSVVNTQAQLSVTGGPGGSGGNMGPGGGLTITLQLDELRLQCMQLLLLRVPVSNFCNQLINNPLGAVTGSLAFRWSLLTARGDPDEGGAGMGYGGSGPLMLPQMRPSARLILIILREKCKQWQQNGVSPLPYYCWELLGLKMNNRGQGRPSPQRLNSFYDSYASTVSADDRLRDYSAARDRGRPMP
ncbi:hypothetical protein BaRGS_00005133 [Batillaria attramentaria]|uniref:Uncharacterized protein n=1 Tax=Batillaria attramentaria TaxID=370345 RepID=A0ABD0LVG2_9CAEN